MWRNAHLPHEKCTSPAGDREPSEGAVTFTFSSRRTSARAYFDAACCRHRCSYFAAWITLICGSVTVVEYKWSSARRADHRPDRHQWICYVGRLLSYHTHSSPSPPRHIPSTTHFPSPATRTSAGYFVAPAGVLALRGLVRLVGRGRSTFTCCCWSPRRGAWNGCWHGCQAASRPLFWTL